MASRSAELLFKSRTDKYSLLMEQPERRNENEHVIDIRRSVEAASSSSVHDRVSNELDPSHSDNRPSSSARTAISQLSLPLSNISNSRNSQPNRRSNAHSRRRRSPLNSGLWIAIELALAVVQIVVSVIVLSLSRNEHPSTPLFAWIVGYASGCVATLPLLYWRYLHRNQVAEQDSVQSRQSSSNGTSTTGLSFSTTQTQEDDNRVASSSNRGASGLSAVIHNARYKPSVHEKF